MRLHIQAYTHLKKITDCQSNGEVIKYHKFISIVIIELSIRCLNTGPEDRLGMTLLHAKTNAQTSLRGSAG